MSSTSLSDASVASKSCLWQNRDRNFYLTVAIASAALVFIGFARTFYLKAYFGTPVLQPLVILHGIVLTAWMLFFVAQAALIATHRPRTHRQLGYPGAVFAAVVVVLGIAVATHGEKLGHRVATQDAESVYLVGLGDILTFCVFFLAAFLRRRNREAHQRLMVLAVVAGLNAAAIPRLPIIGVTGGVTPGMIIVGLVFLLSGPIYDLISRHRIHPVYIWGCAFALVTGPPVRLLLASTHAWHQMARWLVGL